MCHLSPPRTMTHKNGKGGSNSHRAYHLVLLKLRIWYLHFRKITWMAVRRKISKEGKVHEGRGCCCSPGNRGRWPTSGGDRAGRERGNERKGQWERHLQNLLGLAVLGGWEGIVGWCLRSGWVAFLSWGIQERVDWQAEKNMMMLALSVLGVYCWWNIQVDVFSWLSYMWVWVCGRGQGGQ